MWFEWRRAWWGWRNGNVGAVRWCGCLPKHQLRGRWWRRGKAAHSHAGWHRRHGHEHLGQCCRVYVDAGPALIEPRIAPAAWRARDRRPTSTIRHTQQAPERARRTPPCDGVRTRTKTKTTTKQRHKPQKTSQKKKRPRAG